METRILGKDLKVSAIGLGCMGLSHANGAPTEENEAVRPLREAVEDGYTFFDTAETYGYKEDPHNNEKLLGKAFAGMRDKLVIATKFGVWFDFSQDPDHPQLHTDSRPETIRKSVEESLRRLNTGYIDLYYQHRVDPNVEPETVAEVMAELIKEGKIRHWGVSMASEEYIRRAHAVCPLTASQNVYSLIAPDESLFNTFEELNIGLVSCCPIAKGLLTGAYSKGEQFENGDMRKGSAWFSDETMDKTKPLMDYLTQLGAEKNATLGQLSLAWMINKKPWIVPIPGTRKSSRLKENAGAGDIRLTAEEVAGIDAAIAAMNA